MRYMKNTMTKSARNLRQKSARTTQASTTKPSAPATFADTYPHVAEWVTAWGWIVVGQDEYSRSMVRAMDIGGMVWEGKTHYASMDALWQDVEQGLAAWMEENT